MAVCTIARDQNKKIQEVYAPNKKPSILFKDAVDTVPDNDKEAALRIWAKAYTSSFKEKFGDWEKSPTPEMKLDANGEPVIGEVMGSDTDKSAKKEIESKIEEESQWGSRKTIDYFEKQAANINLEEEDDISYYTNGKTDPSTGKPKRFTRLTEFVHGQFIPDKTGGIRKDKFDPEKWISTQAEIEFKNAGADLSDKISYRDNSEPQTFEQVREQIKISYETARIKGKIMHKMIEGFLKHGDPGYFQKELSEFYQEGKINDYEMLWFTEARIKSILSKSGINSADFGNTDVEFRDNVASELMMINEVMGVGTANDGFIEHSDGSVSFIDYKTGGKLLSDEESDKKMLYTDGMADPIRSTKLNKAKLELVMRMVLAKMNKPDLAVRDLSIIYITKNLGEQVRTIDVQNYLDYINNNYKLTIRDLEKKLRSGKITDPQELKETKNLLDQKKAEYKAMQESKVFDFQNYQAETAFVQQQDDLSVLSDPKEKLKWMKDKVAMESRRDIIHGNEISTKTIGSVKKALYGVLNSFKASNITSVESAGTKDISGFSAIFHGLRDQKNAFLQSFSRLYETAVDKVVSREEQLLGEQSAFRKADRALHKEYFQRTGRTQAMGVKTYSYKDGNAEVPIKDQGIFDFMYTWKTIAGESKRIGAVYTEQDVKNGKITKAQWDYYKESKAVLKSVYEDVYNKTAYVDAKGRPVSYAKAYEILGINFQSYKESFLPVIPFQNIEEIAEKNILTHNLNPIKLGKEAWDNYRDKYDLAIQNENRVNIGMPLKYMSSEFLDNDDHSFNVTKAVDIFARHMINKAELDDVYYIGKNTVAALSDVNDKNFSYADGRLRLENTLKALNSHMDQHILGKRRMTYKYVANEKTNKQIDRTLDNVKAFISANAFWFAPVTALFNGLYGVVTNTKEGLIGSLSKRLYGDQNAVTLTDLLKATKICGVHQGKNLTLKSNLKRQFIEDFEGTYYQDKVNYMTKVFRLNNKNYNYTDNSLMLGVHNRIFSQENAYVFQGLGEDLTNEILVVATLLARKVEVRTGVDAQGKEIVKYLKKDGTYTTNPNDSNLENMWDAYKFNEQTKTYEYTGPTRFIDKDGTEVKGLTTNETLRVKTYLERMYGAYSPEQRTHLERYAMGRAVMQFRKFQVMNIRENFTLDSHLTYMGEYVQLFNADGSPKLKDGQPMYDWKSEAMQSRLKAFSSLLGSWYSVANREKWKNLSPENKKQAIRFATQIVFYGIGFAIGLGAMIPPEDKDKMYARRIKRFVQDLSVVDPMNLLQSTTTIDAYPTQLFKASGATYTLINSLITDDRVESGPYKGDYKGANTLENYAPVYHSFNQAVKLVRGE